MSINNISGETKQKINKFAEEQTQNYLEQTEMTYMEQLRRKGSQTKNKVGAKFAKFKAHSAKGEEVRDDMVLYMSDYINDLISQGMSEKEAFDKASEEMAAANKSETDKYVQNGDLNDRIRDYYATKSPAEYDSEGLIYGGFSTIGLVIGGFLGSLFAFLQFIVSPLIGKLSDQYGRKAILIISVIGNLLSSFIW